VHKELCRGSVQLDGSGSWYKMEELGDLAVKRGCLHVVHSCECEIVEAVAFNSLNVGTIESSINAISDRCGSG
jgi:hypothetical protein